MVKKLLATQALDQRQRKQENEKLKQQIAVLEQQMIVVIRQNNETQEKLVIHNIDDGTLVLYIVLKLNIASWKLSESFASLFNRLRM